VNTIAGFSEHVDHRVCVKHLYGNFKKRHVGEQLKEALWKCARSTTMTEFKRAMENVEYLGIGFIVAKTNTRVCWIQCSNILARFSVPGSCGLVHAILISVRKPRLISCSPSSALLSRINWKICF
jgi:hypothetical protein